MLTDLDLQNFQNLCLEEFNLNITNEQASDFGNSLINLLIEISPNSIGDV